MHFHLVFIDLTTISPLDVFADKNHVASRLSLVNVPGLNKLLRSEIFISEDRKQRAAHLILDYEPLSHIFQDVCQAIRAGDPRLAHIDVSKLGFWLGKTFRLLSCPFNASLKK